MRKRPLAGTAIPAGILLLLSSLILLTRKTVTGHPLSGFEYLTIALVVTVGILLLTRTRGLVYGILFAILVTLSVYLGIGWANLAYDAPMAMVYFVRALAFLGVMILTFRRAHVPKRGAWWILAFFPYLFVIGALFVTGFSFSNSTLGFEKIHAPLFYFYGVTEQLLLIGLILLGIAFSRDSAKETPQTNEPRSAVPVEQTSGSPATPAPVSPDPAPSKPVQPSVTEAEYDIIEDVSD